jgi:hypothetical protein
MEGREARRARCTRASRSLWVHTPVLLTPLTQVTLTHRATDQPISAITLSHLHPHHNSNNSSNSSSNRHGLVSASTLSPTSTDQPCISQSQTGEDRCSRTSPLLPHPLPADHCLPTHDLHHHSYNNDHLPSTRCPVADAICISHVLPVSAWPDPGVGWSVPSSLQTAALPHYTLLPHLYDEHHYPHPGWLHPSSLRHLVCLLRTSLCLLLLLHTPPTTPSPRFSQLPSTPPDYLTPLSLSPLHLHPTSLPTLTPRVRTRTSISISLRPLRPSPLTPPLLFLLHSTPPLLPHILIPLKSQQPPALPSHLTPLHSSQTPPRLVSTRLSSHRPSSLAPTVLALIQILLPTSPLDSSLSPPPPLSR